MDQQFSQNTTFAMLGIVRDASDPMEMGRLRVFIPGYDSEFTVNEDLPWCNFMSPFFGITKDIKVGVKKTTQSGTKAYGFWSIPAIGATVLIVCANGDPSMRIWMGCVGVTYNTATLPGGKNSAGGQTSQENKPQAYTDERAAEAGLADDRGRGPFERNVSRDRLNKIDSDGVDGYHTNPNDPSKYESQTYCWTTPGGHYFSMCDSDDWCRVRVRTTGGHQIILDDTNERIYISTGTGKTWLEMDEDGHIHMFGESKVSISSDKDININAEENVHIRANKGNVYIQSVQKKIHIESKLDTTMKSVDAQILLDAKTGFGLYSSNGGYKLTTKDSIHSNTKANHFLTSASATHFKAGSSIFYTAGSHQFVGVNKHADPILCASPILCSYMGAPNLKAGPGTGGPGAAGGPASQAGLQPAVPALGDTKEIMIIPVHEPFTRPKSDISRNDGWNKNNSSSSQTDTPNKKTEAHKGKKPTDNK